MTNPEHYQADGTGGLYGNTDPVEECLDAICKRFECDQPHNRRHKNRGSDHEEFVVVAYAVFSPFSFLTISTIGQLRQPEKAIDTSS